MATERFTDFGATANLANGGPARISPPYKVSDFTHSDPLGWILILGMTMKKVEVFLC